MNRKNFLRYGTVGAVGAASILTGCANNKNVSNSIANVTPNGTTVDKAVYVPQGKNRFQKELMIWGVIPLQIKVSSKDTNGAYFVFEHAKMGKGGPPRHFHYEQDEWFYALEGEFAFEVGDEKFTLHPGDSLFAPRMIPHVWAYIGNQPGTLLLAVQPAGSLEEFFRRSCELARPPSPEEAERSFAAHGMKVVGPPLIIS